MPAAPPNPHQSRLHQLATSIKVFRSRRIDAIKAHHPLEDRMLDRYRKLAYRKAVREAHAVFDRQYNDELNAALNAEGFAPKLVSLEHIAGDGVLTQQEINAANSRLEHCRNEELMALNRWMNNVRGVLGEAEGIRRGLQFWKGAVSLKSLTVNLVIDAPGGAGKEGEMVTIIGAWSPFGAPVLNRAVSEAKRIYREKRREIDQRYAELYSELANPEVRAAAGRTAARLLGASFVERDVKELTGDNPKKTGALGENGAFAAFEKRLNPKEGVEGLALTDEFISARITGARERLQEALREFRALDDDRTRLALATALAGMLSLFAQKDEPQKTKFAKLAEKILKDMREAGTPTAGELRKLAGMLTNLHTRQLELHGPRMGAVAKKVYGTLQDILEGRAAAELTDSERRALAKLDADYVLPARLKHFLMPDEPLSKGQLEELRAYVYAHLCDSNKKFAERDERLRMLRAYVAAGQVDAKQLAAEEKKFESYCKGTWYGKVKGMKVGDVVNAALKKKLTEWNGSFRLMPTSLVQFIGSAGNMPLDNADIESVRLYLRQIGKPERESFHLHAVIGDLGRLRERENTGAGMRPDDFDMSKRTLKRYREGLARLAQFFAK